MDGTRGVYRRCSGSQRLVAGGLPWTRGTSARSAGDRGLLRVSGETGVFGMGNDEGAVGNLGWDDRSYAARATDAAGHVGEGDVL